MTKITSAPKSLDYLDLAENQKKYKSKPYPKIKRSISVNCISNLQDSYKLLAIQQISRGIHVSKISEMKQTSFAEIDFTGFPVIVSIGVIATYFKDMAYANHNLSSNIQQRRKILNIASSFSNLNKEIEEVITEKNINLDELLQLVNQELLLDELNLAAIGMANPQNIIKCKNDLLLLVSDFCASSYNMSAELLVKSSANQFKQDLLHYLRLEQFKFKQMKIKNDTTGQSNYETTVSGASPHNNAQPYLSSSGNISEVSI